MRGKKLRIQLPQSNCTTTARRALLTSQQPVPDRAPGHRGGRSLGHQLLAELPRSLAGVVGQIAMLAVVVHAQFVRRRRDGNRMYAYPDA